MLSLLLIVCISLFECVCLLLGFLCVARCCSCVIVLVRLSLCCFCVLQVFTVVWLYVFVVLIVVA